MDIDKYTIEETLKQFEIEYDDITQLSDGSYGYLFILVTNLLEKQRKVLEELEFFPFTDDVWWRRGEEIANVPKKRVVQIIDTIYGNNSKAEEKALRKSIAEQWETLITQIKDIAYASAGKKVIKITHNDILIACKYKDYLCANNDTMRLFLNDLDSLLETIFKKFKSFFENVSSYKLIRNFLIHDKEKSNASHIIEAQDEIKKLIGKPLPRNINDYWKLQERVIIDIREVLEGIYNDIVRSKHDTNQNTKS